MAHDNVSLSSASISSVVSSDTSGRKAAQPLSAQSDVGALNGKDGVADVKATAVAQADVASSAKSRADETQQARELQQKEMQKQAALIVKYPTAIKIDDSLYNYFVLWADKAHIEPIGSTLSFL